MTNNEFFGFAFGMIAAFGMGFLVPLFLFVFVPKQQTIIPHESGNAVYIAGEACTINTTPDIDLAQLQKLLVHCSVHHMEYLSEEKRK